MIRKSQRTTPNLENLTDEELKPNKYEVYDYNPGRSREWMGVVNSYRYIEDIRVGMSELFSNAKSCLLDLPKTRKKIYELESIFFNFLNSEVKKPIEQIPYPKGQSDENTPTRLIRSFIELPIPVLELIQHMNYVLSNFMNKSTAEKYSNFFRDEIRDTFEKELFSLGKKDLDLDEELDFGEDSDVGGEQIMGEADKKFNLKKTANKIETLISINSISNESDFLIDFEIDPKIDSFFQDYGEKGYNEILDTIEFLKNEIKRNFQEINKNALTYKNVFSNPKK